MAWGIVADKKILHIVPLVDLDGERVMSAAHQADMYCPCNPTFDPEYSIANHHDPEHPGSLEREDETHGIQ